MTSWVNFLFLLLGALISVPGALLGLFARFSGYQSLAAAAGKLSAFGDHCISIGRVDANFTGVNLLSLPLATFFLLPSSTMALQYLDLIKTVRAEWDAGVEDENNWQRRNKLLRKLAELLDGDQEEQPTDLYDHLKPFFSHLILTCATERTTLGVSALACLSSIFKVLGTQMSPQLDHMLPQLITLSGVTKKMTSKSAGDAMNTVCLTIGYNLRLIAHVCDAFKEKATSARLFAAGWLKDILRSYHKQLDPIKDIPRIEVALLTGLQDSQNTVREAIRPAYWRYAKINASSAATIMDKLPKDKANALKNHPDNPERSTATSQSARPTSALSQIKARSKVLNKSTATKSSANVPTVKDTESQTLPKAPAAQRQPLFPRSTTAPVGTRDFSQSTVQSYTSTTSSVYPAGQLDRVTAPDGIDVELPGSPKATSRSKLEAAFTFDKAVIEKKRYKYAPEYRFPTAEPDLSAAEQARQDEAALKAFNIRNPEKAAATDRKLKDESTKAKQIDNNSLRNLMSAPIRRPRVAVTPINQAQPPVRPSSKSEVRPSSKTEVRPSPKTEVRPSSKGEPKKTHQKKESRTKAPVYAEASRDAEIPYRQTKPHVAVETPVPSPIVHAEPTVDPPAPSPVAYLQSTVDESVPSPVIYGQQNVEAQTPSPITHVQAATKPVQHIIDGQENTFTYNDGCSHKKAYETCTNKTNNSRSEVSRLKEALRNGKLDALGHKKLSGLLRDKPGQMVTTQADFDELYTLLVQALTLNADVSAPAGNAARNRGHPFYNRHALIDSIIRLLEQFPDAGEPHPGMALIAVLKSKEKHPDTERFRTAATIEAAALNIIRLTQPENILASIDNLAEEYIEYHLTGGTDPAVGDLALRCLATLLDKAKQLDLTLFEVQERLMIEVAKQAWQLKNSRDVMSFAVALQGHIRPENGALLEGSTDGDLLMYYASLH